MTKPQIARPAGIDKAVELYGSQEKLADEFGVKRQAVQQWVAKGYVPMERVKSLAELTGIDASELCNPKVAEIFK